MNYTFYIQNYVDSSFKKYGKIDHEKVSKDFTNELRLRFNNEQFENLLIVSGFIPDLYEKDSSQETLFSKLIESIVGEWARRIGATGELIKQKASYEDVKITINDKIVVCDAKSFRLGRSQQAPNAKDFLKLEDIRKWMARYSNSIGGLVTFPCKHEWSKGSDIYQYCSTKDAPTVMLPYKYLALILHFKDNFSLDEFKQLWNYNAIFPNKLSNKSNNKKEYWNAINNRLISILKIDLNTLNSYIKKADKKIDDAVKENLDCIQQLRTKIISKIQSSIQSETDIERIKKNLIEYQIHTETRELDYIIQRYNNWRL